MKKLLGSLLGIVLLLTGCSSASHGSFNLSLNPVPLTMKVDSAIVTHLSVAKPSGDYANFAKKEGAISQSIIYYTPATGSKVIFASFYEFPIATFNRLSNPDQPPAFGQEIVRKGGIVFSVAGPQDSIFDPNTPDGKNISTLYSTLTKSSTYEVQE